MGVFVVYDKQIKIPPRGVKVFSVEIISTEDMNVFLRFEDLNAVCYNCSGTDYLGKEFDKTVSLKKGVPHRLWCGVDCAGKGYITVYGDKNTLLFKDEIRAEISENAEDIAQNGGNWQRLAWLNSTIGIDHSVPKPFLPVD